LYSFLIQPYDDHHFVHFFKENIKGYVEGLGFGFALLMSLEEM
jgi:hypothetical protein